jgi:carboxyl-terminal processing protease
VKVGVIRRGKTDPEEVDVVRTKLPEPKLQVQKVDNDTIAIRFATLNAGHKDELRAKLLEAEKQGVSKVILDVRDCGRGQISEAIEIARLFVTSGTLTKLHGQTIKEDVFTAEQSDLEGSGFGADGRNDNGRGGSAGCGDCEYQARRSGG